MIDKSKNIWLVRAGEGGYLIDEFISNGVIALGCNEIGDMSLMSTNEDVKEAYRQSHPNYSIGKVRTATGQWSRFAFQFNKGDYVVTYDTEERKYHIGTIESEYKYDDSILEDMNHIREVNWFDEVMRDKFSTSAKNTLGSALTIIQINDDVKDELGRLLSGVGVSEEDEETEDQELDLIKDDITLKAREFIKDKINSLEWEEMEKLVAGLLRAMGYKTRITPAGPDRGRDIIASPDGLGFEDPRIICEVKHRSVAMGSSEIRSFTGGLRSRDKGLYVSTGGFTKEAKYEAERTTMPITIIDSTALVNLVIQYYDDFDVETKALLPLQKIYWPA